MDGFCIFCYGANGRVLIVEGNLMVPAAAEQKQIKTIKTYADAAEIVIKTNRRVLERLKDK